MTEWTSEALHFKRCDKWASEGVLVCVDIAQNNTKSIITRLLYKQLTLIFHVSLWNKEWWICDTMNSVGFQSIL